MGTGSDNHIANPEFGFSRFDETTGLIKPGEISRVLGSGKKFDDIDAQLLLREAYEIDFGINDHRLTENQGPMNLVKMNPKENPRVYSHLYQTIRRYGLYKVQENFGYNLSQFLELPREFIELLLHIGAELAQMSNQERTDAIKEIEKMKVKGTG